MFGTDPKMVTCPHCQAVTTTNLEKETPSELHFATCLLCIFFFPLAWLPYCLNENKVNHYCSVCNALLGTYLPTNTYCYAPDDAFSCCLPIVECCKCEGCCEGETCCGNSKCCGENEEQNRGEVGGCGDCPDCGGECPDCGGDCPDCDCGGCDCDCGGCDCNF